MSTFYNGVENSYIICLLTFEEASSRAKADIRASKIIKKARDIK